MWHLQKIIRHWANYFHISDRLTEIFHEHFFFSFWNFHFLIHFAQAKFCLDMTPSRLRREYAFDNRKGANFWPRYIFVFIAGKLLSALKWERPEFRSFLFSREMASPFPAPWHFRRNRGFLSRPHASAPNSHFAAIFPLFRPNFLAQLFA